MDYIAASALSKVWINTRGQIDLIQEKISLRVACNNNQNNFELVEHLRDPFAFMLSVHKLLLDDGLHHFCTPNILGFDNVAIGYNGFRPLAHGIFPPMHLHSFTTQNIIHFSIRSGFKVAQLDTPGNFDVGIVASAIDGNSSNQFSFISEFTEKQLGIFQHWLKLLSASSHMRCTLLK